MKAKSKKKPVVLPISNKPTAEPPMEARDVFAAFCAAGFIAASGNSVGTVCVSPEDVAARAYRVADALVARGGLWRALR